MTRLRVTPAHRYGGDRWYVTRPDGTGVAWYDRAAGRVSLLPGVSADDVLAVLGPHLSGEVRVGPPAVPTAAELDRLALPCDDDLAPNRPGEELYGEGPHAGARAGGRVAGELLARRLVGERLDRLERVGWRILHSVPLPAVGAEPAPRDRPARSGGRAASGRPGGPGRLDHLAIGPAGVLAVRTLAAHRRRVRITDPEVRTGRAPGPARPDPLGGLDAVRDAAERASRTLATAVRPVLVVVGASRLVVRPVPRDVHLLHDSTIPELAALGGVLKRADVESLYAAARDRRVWAGA